MIYYSFSVRQKKNIEVPYIHTTCTIRYGIYPLLPRVYAASWWATAAAAAAVDLSSKRRRRRREEETEKKITNNNNDNDDDNNIIILMTYTSERGPTRKVILSRLYTFQKVIRNRPLGTQRADGGAVETRFLLCDVYIQTAPKTSCPYAGAYTHCTMRETKNVTVDDDDKI